MEMPGPPLPALQALVSQLRLQGFRGSSRPSAGWQRGTRHGEPRLLPCQPPPPTARYPGTLLTDEDAEGLRGSEVPQEVPVPFQPSLLCGERSPTLSY